MTKKTKKRSDSSINRPLQARSQNLVQSIFTAATRILEKKGFDYSTTNRIAELAGVSIGSFYQYFSSKEALVGKLMEKQIKKNLDSINTIIKEAQLKDLDNGIPFLVDRVVELVLVEKGFFRNLFIEALRLNQLSALVEAREQGALFFQEFLRPYSAQLRSQDIKTLSFICTNAVMGSLQIYALLPEEPIDRETLKSELSLLLLNYIRRE